MAAHKALWSEIDGEPWLDNPRRRKRRRSTARRTHRRKHRRNRMPAALARYWAGKRKRGGSTMARRRHHRSNPRRHHRRRFRRNPGLTRGFTGNIMKGIKGGTGVVLGKAAVRAIPTLVRLPTTGIMGAAVQGITGVLLAPMVSRFLGGEWGTAFLYGAFAAPIESLIVGMNVPVLGPALSAYPGEGMGAIPGPGITALAAPAVLPGFTFDEEESALVQ